MPLKITHRKEEEVPRPTAAGRINENVEAIKAEMQKLGQGMVLEIETGSERAIRGTKALITRASKELGTKWRHWSQGTKVFARPAESVTHRRRRRRSKPVS
jgi:hypothetical protein